MGKGDKKSKKGKIVRGSYGVRRLRKKKNAYVAVPKSIVEVAVEEADEKKAPAKKAPKAAAKKKEN